MFRNKILGKRNYQGKWQPSLAKYCCIITLRIYQIFLSPLIGNHCRFLPTCSEYAIEAICKHGCIRGIKYSFKRLIRCQPKGNSGYDPVP